ncbi:MAG: type Z 30S ribosomal protein S14 [Candidatus Peribacteria bacterium]|jgi:small subunit ribosomal protein S14|nr:type Z 30S ribosomal protein S14 [Candidatus Peribacteria bacterium]
MARAALKSKQGKMYEKRFTEKVALKQPTKFYNRCRLCGRSKAYVRDFGICRVCLRRYAREGLIMGLRKASW